MKGYTKEMIKEILGTAWLEKDNMPETGNQIRRRKGQEMRAGKRPIFYRKQDQLGQKKRNL